MSCLPTDCVAIDTNVFWHLTSNSINKDKHIHVLLSYFMKNKTFLLVDKGGKIAFEYNYHLNELILRERLEHSIEGYILRYFLQLGVQRQVQVSKDALWNAIHKVIPGKNEEEDRTFVYVAFVSGSIVISNDRKHIVNRHVALKAATRTMGLGKVEVMTSQTAHGRI